MSLKQKFTAIALAAVLSLGLAFGGASNAHAGDLTAELQDLVAGLSTEQQSALLLLLSELGGGEGGGAAANTPEAALKAGMDELLKAAAAGDVAGIMAYVHEDFDYYQVGDKEALEGFIQGAVDAGYIEMYIDDVEVNIEDAEIEQDGDEYTVYPIEIGGPFGSITVEVVCEKVGDKFLVTTLDIYGI